MLNYFRYDDITRLFERYGKIVDIRIPIDYNSRSSRGFAFVQYPFFYVYFTIHISFHIIFPLTLII